MGTEKVRVVIIGCGLRAATLLAHILATRGAQIVALVDERIGNARRLADWLGAQAGYSPSCYDDVNRALNDFPQAAVFLLTPQFTHLELVRAARGRAIFLEKPLAHRAPDCLEIYRLLRDNPAPVQIGFVLRLAPFYRKVKSLLAAGELGRVLQIQMHQHLSPEHAAQYRLNWRRRRDLSGGLLNEKACHDLDLMFWLVDSLPVRMFSRGNRGIFPQRDGTPRWCSECDLECRFRNSYHRFNRHVPVIPALEELVLLPATDPLRVAADGCVFHTDADIMEQQTVVCEFAGGTLGTFSLVTLGDEDRREIRVYGERGLVEGCLERGRLRWFDYESSAERIFTFQGEDPHGGGDAAIVADFLDAVAGRGVPTCPLRAGAAASLAAFAADKSLALGRPLQVKFDLDGEAQS